MRSQLPSVGKISSEIFDQLIFPNLGAPNQSVLVGPQHGVDIAVVDLGHDRVMALTTDPVFVVPQFGWDRAAWFAIHILASDAVTSCLRPTYLAIDLNLPRSIQTGELELLWSGMHRECRQLGMAIVSGHTARYDGCEYPMVGGATVMCVGPKSDYLTPQMAQPGDVIILTKGAAIEATGIFAVTFGARIARAFGEPFAARAKDLFRQMSVVDDALAAVSVGVHQDGVTALHDATEGGILGGLWEVAQASRVGLVVEKDKIPISEEAEKICALFGMDPFSAISEGSLIITCRPQHSDRVVAALHGKGIQAAVIGSVTPRAGGIRLIDQGQEHPLVHPQVDPFWEAFQRAVGEQADHGPSS